MGSAPAPLCDPDEHGWTCSCYSYEEKQTYSNKRSTCQSAIGPIITSSPRTTLHHPATIAPNVQTLLPISQVHRPLVLRGAVDSFINVLADACPRPRLSWERLAAAQLEGRGDVTGC